MNFLTNEFVIRVIVCAIIIYFAWEIYEKLGKKNN